MVMTTSSIFGTSFDEFQCHDYRQGIGKNARKEKKAKRKVQKQSRKNNNHKK